jgi:hypothetical protein
MKERLEDFYDWTQATETRRFWSGCFLAFLIGAIIGRFA